MQPQQQHIEQHAEQHAASINGVDGQSEAGEVGVNGYNVLESAPRRQPADVTMQAAPARLQRVRRQALFGSSWRRRHDFPLSQVQ